MFNHLFFTVISRLIFTTPILTQPIDGGVLRRTFNANNDCEIVQEKIGEYFDSPLNEAISVYFQKTSSVLDCNPIKQLQPRVKFIYSGHNEEYADLIYIEKDYRRVIKTRDHLLLAIDFPNLHRVVNYYYKSKRWNAQTFLFVVLNPTETTNRTLTYQLNEFSRKATEIYIREFQILVWSLNDCSISGLTLIDDCFRTVKLNTQSCWMSTSPNTTNQHMYVANFHKCVARIRVNTFRPFSYRDADNYFAGIGGAFTKFLIDWMQLNYTAYESPWCEWPAKKGVEYGKPDIENEFGIVKDPRILMCTQTQGLGSFYSWNVLDYMYQDEITFIITKAGLVEPWKLLLYLMSGYAWLWYMLVFVSVCAVWALIRFNANHVTGNHLSDSVLPTYSITLGQAVPFSSTHFKARILLITWLIYSFEFSIVLQSRYTDLLSKQLYEKQVQTLADIVEYNVPIYTAGDFSNLDVVVNGKKLSDQRKYLTVTNKNDWTMDVRDEFVRQGSHTIAYVKERMQLDYLKKFFYDNATGNLFVIVCKDHLTRYFVSPALVTKDHVYTQRLNTLIHRSHAAGFAEDFRDFLDYTLKFLEKHTSPTTFSPLGFADILMPIYIFTVGVGLGAVDFLWECMTRCWKV